ncbi:MAG: hypothetical protein ACRDFC_07350 [Ignavibacteria bacterium]
MIKKIICILILMKSFGISNNSPAQIDSNKITTDTAKYKTTSTNTAESRDKWFPDPNESRLFIVPTGKTLPAGQWYVSTLAVLPIVFLPFVNVGVTDFISIGGGVSLIPFSEYQFYYISPKVRLLNFKYFQFSTGFLHINTFSKLSDNGFSLFYGVGTLGTKFTSLNLGVGYNFFEGWLKRDAVFQIGGEIRAGENNKIISENWFHPSFEIGLISLGMRFFGENFAADILIVAIPSARGGHPDIHFPAYPLVSFTYNFNTKAEKHRIKTNKIIKFKF